MTIPLAQTQQVGETDNVVLEKLPLGDPDLIKEGLERSPLASIFPSPTNFSGPPFVYGSPLGIGMTLPFSGMGGSPSFGGHIDFTSLLNATSNQGGGNMPSSIFGSGNCSPCLFQASLTPGNDYYYRADDKDN